MTDDDFAAWLAKPTALRALLETVEELVNASSHREADQVVVDVYSVWHEHVDEGGG